MVKLHVGDLCNHFLWPLCVILESDGHTMKHAFYKVKKEIN